jgi:hypothetical protein
MALNIVMGSALGNISAAQFLQIPDAQLNADVRAFIATCNFITLIWTHDSVNQSADLLHRPFR